MRWQLEPGPWLPPPSDRVGAYDKVARTGDCRGGPAHLALGFVTRKRRTTPMSDDDVVRPTCRLGLLGWVLAAAIIVASVANFVRIDSASHSTYRHTDQLGATDGDPSWWWAWRSYSLLVRTRQAKDPESGSCSEELTRAPETLESDIWDDVPGFPKREPRQDPYNATGTEPATHPQTYQAFMRERAVSRDIIRVFMVGGHVETGDSGSLDRIGCSGEEMSGAPWWVGTRLSPAPTPMGGEAVRCLGIHPPRTMWWAWSGTATATAGLIHMRRPAPGVGSCLISSSQPLPCPNLTPPPSGSGSHRPVSRNRPG